ncbi:MAG: 1-deoxy-D-xylulose-5-phosphate synthase [Clostridia bacterium]|nr:1-deoxy-D-xylulose-5-phosphate synthase [Clostridia bacterium]
MQLSEIRSPKDLRGLNDKELKTLAGEIRTEIIRTVARNGGHLASNLGVVEMTIALHRAFDCPRDKIVFDVGHQCYAHKMLTGRYEAFSTLRQLDGLCGFPRREESGYDAFDTGHASTAISAAAGLARARDLQGGDWHVAALAGDGALTGGMCYEALSDVGSRRTQLLLIINDNEMSISRNTGALAKQLTRLRLSRGWLGMKHSVAEGLLRVPGVGKGLHRAFQKVKNRLRNALVKDRFFTALGFRYFGPIDGHDIRAMEKVFRRLMEMQEPVAVHVVTKKGAGFAEAEEKPEKYHGVAPFVLDNGRTRNHSGPSAGASAGQHACALAEKDARVCAVTAAMTDSTGFGPFAKQFPDRLFDVGIAEEHAVTLAAGLAAGGMRPMAVIYESFMQRAFDQIAVDVCLQKLPVLFLMDRAGIGGEDGATHHGILGVSMLRAVPGLPVLAPRCPEELRGMMDWAFSQDGPAAIRYPRDLPEGLPAYGAFSFGKWEPLREGKDAAILASSAILKECMDAAALLEKAGVSAAVINASTLRPLDGDMLLALDEKGVPVFTVEEHMPSGGFGEAVAAHCVRAGLTPPRGMLAIDAPFVPHGSRSALLRRLKLDAEGIADAVRKAVKP